MPKIVYKSRRLDVIRPTLDRVIDAYLQNPGSTRQRIADICSVSKTTVCKVASALTECGFASERIYANSGERPARHLFATEDMNIMLIDVSSAHYTISIVSTGYCCLFHQGYSYDSAESFENNLNLFLSKCGYLARKCAKPYTTIAVIYADMPSDQSAFPTEGCAYLPSTQDKSLMDEMIHSVFHRYPDYYVGTSEAVHNALKYSLIPLSSDRYGLAYIFAGSYVSSFFVDPSGVQFCNAGSLIVDGVTASRLLAHPKSTDDINRAVSHLVNFMTCAFGACSCIIESDSLVLNDATAQSICRTLAKAGELAPNLILTSASPSVKHKGAVAYVLARTVKRFIIASDEKK